MTATIYKKLLVLSFVAMFFVIAGFVGGLTLAAFGDAVKACATGGAVVAGTVFGFGLAALALFFEPADGPGQNQPGPPTT
ncbi:hypothetical protein AB0N06_33465 [Streptomyces sp. NPDC051020]|uniref:hypothetical protein n=1 Tax=Streptomyces sp. NPDC051020 TaxID=3155409 RepID=UPI003439A1BE